MKKFKIKRLKNETDLDTDTIERWFTDEVTFEDDESERLTDVINDLPNGELDPMAKRNLWFQWVFLIKFYYMFQWISYYMLAIFLCRYSIPLVYYLYSVS